MKKMLKKLLLPGALAASLWAAPVLAQVQVHIGIPVVVPPPPAFVATAVPVYYEGRPTYFYQGRWYYRDGRGWRHFRDEPAYLYNYRVRAPPPRVYYGPPRGGPGPRGPGPGPGYGPHRYRH